MNDSVRQIGPLFFWHGWLDGDESIFVSTKEPAQGAELNRSDPRTPGVFPPLASGEMALPGFGIDALLTVEDICRAVGVPIKI